MTNDSPELLNVDPKPIKRECSYCGGSDMVTSGMPSGVHFGLPIYHAAKGGHTGVETLICTTCGRVELFIEKLFQKYENQRGES